jgi:cytochrome bd-type quinol oxidase subunit 2
MTELTKPRFNLRKFVMQLVVGAVSGAAITYGTLKLLDGSGFDADDPSRMLALAVGLVFAIIGVFVALGVAVPRAGAHLLNVEDADELREQRKTLRSSALLFVLTGAGLLALALGGAEGEQRLLSLAASAMIAAACFAAVVLLAVVNRNSGDEMMRSMSRQASVVALYTIAVLAILWAILAHLGRAPQLDSLGVLAGILAIQLVSVFVVVGRGGLLVPR